MSAIIMGNLIENPKSGTGTATATATALDTLLSISEEKISGLVTLQVPSTEAAGIEVIANGYATGLLIANDGAPVSLYCMDISKFLIKRQGGSDISFRALVQ